jgi:hypothetical protein
MKKLEAKVSWKHKRLSGKQHQIYHVNNENRLHMFHQKEIIPSCSFVCIWVKYECVTLHKSFVIDVWMLRVYLHFHDCILAKLISLWCYFFFQWTVIFRGDSSFIYLKVFHVFCLCIYIYYCKYIWLIKIHLYFFQRFQCNDSASINMPSYTFRLILFKNKTVIVFNNK